MDEAPSAAVVGFASPICRCGGIYPARPPLSLEGDRGGEAIPQQWQKESRLMISGERAFPPVAEAGLTPPLLSPEGDIPLKGRQEVWYAAAAGRAQRQRGPRLLSADSGKRLTAT
jgi:hypothetical protein